MANDFTRKIMDEATEKLNQYVRSLVRAKQSKQAEAFCEGSYAHIAWTGFLKRLIAARITQDTDKPADTDAAPENLYETVRNRLSGKMKIDATLSKSNDVEWIEIHAGEGVVLKLQRDDSGDCSVTVCVPENHDISDDIPADPNMPDGKEEAKPLTFSATQIDAFCSAAEYILDNAHEFKEWPTFRCWRLWEKYKYLDYPKKDVYDKVPEYWWSEWLESASKEDLTDLEFIKKLVARRGECFSHAPDALKSDRKTALKAIKDFSYAMTFASEELQNDRGFVLQALESNSGVFEYVKENFKDDKKVALRAVQKSGSNLEYVSERLKNDPEVVEAALADDISYLRYASPELRDNKEHAMNAVSKRGALLEVLSERLQNDKQVVMAAVTANGAALKYVTKEWNNDRDVVMAAVTDCGEALEYASDALRADRQIVLAAITNCGKALQYASDDLRDDTDIALTAIRIDTGAYYYVSERLTRDIEVIHAALTAGGHEIMDAVPEDMRRNPELAVFMLEAVKEQLPDMEDYGTFADGTSEYYNEFEYSEDAFCEVVTGIPTESLKSDQMLVERICDLAVSVDDAYYDEGDYPYESSHTRLPDRLKEYFEENDIPYSDILNQSIEAREAKKYHPKEYSEDIPLVERLFMHAEDWYEWWAEHLFDQDGFETHRNYLGPNGRWVDQVMVRFVKSLIANWEGLYHDDDCWNDDDYEVDLDKTYEDLSRQLSSKMVVKREASEYYYSENVRVFVNDNIRLILVRTFPLRILNLWVNHYNSERERGFWIAPDRLDVLCDMVKYIQDNYGIFEKKAKERAAKLLEKYVKSRT